MRSLTKNLDRATELLRLAVNAPRFDEEPFERVREHMNARLRHDANDPATVANRNWKAKAFPDHPYGQPAEGSLEGLGRIRRADLVEAGKRGIARDELMIAVVGAIDERGAAALVDKAFADLPAKGVLTVPLAVTSGFMLALKAAAEMLSSGSTASALQPCSFASPAMW